MDKKAQYSLKADIVSYCKGGHVYGHTGDEVLIIAEHGHVLIAEGKNGERFPVNVNNLQTGAAVENKEPVPLEVVADKIPVRKTKPVKIINQSSLF